MSKRFPLTLFTLGMMFALTGSTGAGNGANEGLNPIDFNNPNAQLYNEVDDARPATASFKKPSSALREYQMTGAAPAPPGGYFCDLQRYYDPQPIMALFWSIPDAYGDDLFNMRFTVEAGVECTLKVGWILMQSAFMTGTPDFRAYLWDDDGFGFPGNRLDSVTIPFADIPANSWWWARAEWPNTWVMGPNEEYHIGWTTLGGDGDTLFSYSDMDLGPHSGEHRSSENRNGHWGLMVDDWSEGDIMFFIESERCGYAAECCVGVRGDIDGLGVEGSEIDISDLVFLIDYMFTDGPPPPCFEEGDVDGSDVSPIDISDLVYLVDYMFTGGPPPPSCL